MESIHNASALVQSRRSRQSGALIEVWDCRGTEEWPWCAVCVDHDVAISNPSREGAEFLASRPSGWCEECFQATPVERRTTL
jgi:hypothetical protein